MSEREREQAQRVENQLHADRERRAEPARDTMRCPLCRQFVPIVTHLCPAETEELRDESARLRDENAQLRAELAAAEDAALRNAEMLHSVMRSDRTLDLVAERDEARDLVRRMVAGQLLPKADYPWLDEET
jgi:dynactin complex subunit